MEPLSMLGIGAVVVFVAGILLFVFVPNVRGGKVEISENEVGLVYKKFAINPLRRNLKKSQLIAGRGEPGYQAYTLATGRHYGYWRWQYSIERVPLTVIPPGRIGLVVAEDGQTRLPHQLLGRAVDCQDFQDGQAFLQNSGQKGRQLHILPGGAYRINTKLFTVITPENAAQHGLTVQNLTPYIVEEGKIGIVHTMGGAPLPAGEIAGPIIAEHDNFQNPQAFLDAGGCRGLQEEYLSPGSYRLNPWFVKVKQISLTRIPPGTVGVVISHVGKTPETSGILVEPGYKGIWKTPLYTGRHPINGEIVDVALVPTNPIALDWSNKPKDANNYDANLRPLRVRSKDGFEFEIEVTQVIRIDAIEAPKMIASIGVPRTDEANLAETTQIFLENQKYTAIRSLVTKVLEPTISSYFRTSAQGANALDFHNERIKRALEAKDYIDHALEAHGVQTVDTMINEIDLPFELAKPLQERAVHEQNSLTLQKELATQQERHKIRQDDVEFNARMAEVESNTKLLISQKEAEAIRLRKQAEAEAIRAEIEAKGGPEMYEKILRAAAMNNIQLPLIMTSGGSGGFMEMLMAERVGIDLSQPKLSAPKETEFTVEQLDLFVKTFAGYLQEGGADTIRTALLPLATGAKGSSYQAVEADTPKQIEGSIAERRQIAERNTSINRQSHHNKPEDANMSSDSVVTKHRKTNLADLQ